MKCRFCNTEIAEKALICYRCGRATTDPKVAPPPQESLFVRRRSKKPYIIAVVILVVLALLAWYFLGMGGVRAQGADRLRPIIDGWVDASSGQPHWLHSSCSAPCRTARWAPGPAATSNDSGPLWLVAGRPSA